MVSYGLGHIYLGIFNRGIAILIVGIVSSMVVSILIPFPYDLIVIIGYWISQIIGAYKRYKKLNVGYSSHKIIRDPPLLATWISNPH